MFMVLFGADNLGSKKTGDNVEDLSDSHEPVADLSPDDVNERISKIIFEVIERRNVGEQVSDAEVIAAHPDLMPDLRDELRGLQQIRLAILMGKNTSDSDQQDRPLPKQAESESEEPQRNDVSDSTRALRLHGYVITQEISSGGQATVFKAIQERTGRIVAIKVFHGGPFVGSRGRKRFDRESEILARLNHPNIVSILDRGRTGDGSFFLVMEFIDGVNLDVHLQELGKDPITIARIFGKIARAVEDAHREGVVHRDLKPMNILVDRRGEPHILDFGMARLLYDFDEGGDEAAHATLTRTGQVLGSLPWSSPEQSMGQHDAVDARTDVYALGIMLFCAFAGDFPYPLTGNPNVAARKISNTPPALAPLAVRNGITLPKGIDDVVRKALLKDPSHRHASAQALADDLDACVAGNPPSIPRIRSRLWWIIRILVLSSVSIALMYVVWVRTHPDPSFVNQLGMTLVRIPHGTVHPQAATGAISIDHDFYLSATPITQDQYLMIIGGFTNQHFYDFKAPIHDITKSDAIAFCRALSRRDQHEYRLPTVDEWKYAYYSGQIEPLTKKNLDSVAWYANNSGHRVRPVGRKLADRWGLYDMIGNVRVWCTDSDYPQSLATAMGTDYSTSASDLLAGKIEIHPPEDTGDSTIGFRVVCESAEQK